MTEFCQLSGYLILKKRENKHIYTWEMCLCRYTLFRKENIMQKVVTFQKIMRKVMFHSGTLST